MRGGHIFSPVTISLFLTSIDLDPIFEKDRDLDRFRFSKGPAGRSVVVLNASGVPGDIRSHMSLSDASQGTSDDGMSEAG